MPDYYYYYYFINYYIVNSAYFMEFNLTDKYVFLPKTLAGI